MHLARRIPVKHLRTFSHYAALRDTSGPRTSDTDVTHQAAPDSSASAKLFADAAREEAEEAANAKPRRRDPAAALLSEHENWTGEESVRDAVLRMLVDKYKPLRSDFTSADEKLRRAPPKVTTRELEDDERSLAEYLANPESIPIAHSEGAAPIPTASTSFTTASTPSTSTYSSASPPPPSGVLANVPLLPADPNHRPWHTTFKAPSHAASVRLGNFPPPAKRPKPLPDDERARRAAMDKRKRTAQATRLTGAREATLDYRLGLKPEGTKAPPGGRPMPNSMKGWASLVDERIEKARMEGRFANLPGRGQPLQRTTEEHNPFIAREEFLMNRIVQRQGAAPPWVEVQGELESAANSFRSILVDSWTRRALRNLTRDTPAHALPALTRSMTLEQAQALRDDAWTAREKAYHDEAVNELNALVRKYNGLAPYAVRRPYYMREAELAKAYERAGEEIINGLKERVAKGDVVQERGVSDEDNEMVLDTGKPVTVLKVRDVLRGWVRRWTGG